MRLKCDNRREEQDGGSDTESVAPGIKQTGPGYEGWDAN